MIFCCLYLLITIDDNKIERPRRRVVVPTLYRSRRHYLLLYSWWEEFLSVLLWIDVGHSFARHSVASFSGLHECVGAWSIFCLLNTNLWCSAPTRILNYYKIPRTSQISPQFPSTSCNSSHQKYVAKHTTVINVKNTKERYIPNCTKRISIVKRIS